jgi:hypothetical protein
MQRFRQILFIVIFSILLQACAQHSPSKIQPTLTAIFSTPAATLTPYVFEPLSACDNFFLPM